ncbi:XrtA/PEP-CTERM system TPR-repeat protein PrsT [Humitalea sp. 24SJ18S-53]|uniref:XrtA/PEP-CTERM system TPR-repeat protein PrsT n=1 Tax=Humitalea sp. 24SJ18S-53 TaxID=3422307 RepID=UPI003D67DE28
MTSTRRPFVRPSLPTGLLPAARTTLLLAGLIGGLGMADAHAAAPDRARAALARGDLRAAQIEWRNAVREDPASAEVRAALAAASLEIGDGETAEREARAAMERGYDAAAGTSLLVRAFLVSGRFDGLLEAFPTPVPETPAGGQAAAGRAVALLALGQVEPAREAAATAQRLAPGATEPDLAAAQVAVALRDRATADALIDGVLARAPDTVDAILRKGAVLYEQRDIPAAVAMFNRAIALVPGHLAARLRRAEALMALGDTAAAKTDIDAVLATVPNMAPGLYLRARLLAGNDDWAGADAALQRMGPAVGNFNDGYLLLAAARRALGQAAQAEDAAQRHFARFPADPRGAKMLATFAMEANRPGDALVALTRLYERGGADAEALDMLGRLHAAAGRRAEALSALQQAAALAPDDAAILARLAAARLAAGDVAGTSAAATDALRRDPARTGAREMLAFTAMARGDQATAAAELDRLDPAARRGEAAGVIDGTLRVMRMELASAKTIFQAVLRDHPNSVVARLGLARVAWIEGDQPDMERLLAEVLRLDPANAEAASQLGNVSQPGAPRAAEARAVLQAAQAAAPGEVGLAMTLASVLLRSGDPAAAARLLATAPLRDNPNPMLRMARTEAHAAAGEWAEAEAAARLALAEMPDSTQARRQLAGLMLRAGDMAGAQALILQGLRNQPGDASLQQALVRLATDQRGVDAGLEQADRLAAVQAALPAARVLRGDLLVAVNRHEEAARAFAAAQAEAPSGILALRLTRALMAAGKRDEATAALRAWVAREPTDDAAQVLLSQLDIEAGRMGDAEARLNDVVARRPDNAVALNNLAWLVGQNADAPNLGRAQALAERAYFLAPSADTADTLGWILARDGKAQQAVPLLRQAVSGQPANQPDLNAAYHLAFALKASGARDEALAVLSAALAPATPFAERAGAERLLADLRAGR